MADNTMTSRIENESTLVLERTFQAPRALVFEAFTRCEHLKHWWGPRGWELPVCEMDFRPGGTWHYCMKCVDESQGTFFGMESWGKARFHEVDAPTSYSYTDYFSDAEGNENPDMPATEATIEFIDLGTATKVVNRSTYVSPDALNTVMDMGMMDGVAQTWDRLAEHLEATTAS